MPQNNNGGCNFKIFFKNIYIPSIYSSECLGHSVLSDEIPGQEYSTCKDEMSVRQSSYWLVVFTKARLWTPSAGLCVKTKTNADWTDTAVIFMVIVFVTVNLHLYDIQTSQHGQQDSHAHLYLSQSFYYTDKHTDTKMSVRHRILLWTKYKYHKLSTVSFIPCKSRCCIVLHFIFIRI